MENTWTNPDGVVMHVDRVQHQQDNQRGRYVWRWHLWRIETDRPHVHVGAFKNRRDAVVAGNALLRNVND